MKMITLQHWIIQHLSFLPRFKNFTFFKKKRIRKRFADILNNVASHEASLSIASITFSSSSIYLTSYNSKMSTPLPCNEVYCLAFLLSVAYLDGINANQLGPNIMLDIQLNNLLRCIKMLVILIRGIEPWLCPQ